MRIHIVKRGETLAKIAKKYQVSLEKLQEINSHIKDGEKVLMGTKVKVPTAEIRLKAKEDKTDLHQEEVKPVIPKVQPVEGYPLETQSIASRTPSPEIPDMPSYEYPPDWSTSMSDTSVDYESYRASNPPYTASPGMMPSMFPSTPPGMGPGVPPQGMPPMMPEMAAPNMINPGMMGMPYGMPPVMPGMMPPSSGCNCGNTSSYPYPQGAPLYGMNAPYEGTAHLHGPYDKNFFTQPHYPTPYQEQQLYMDQPPYTPYQAPPMYPYYGTYMPPTGQWPPMWRNADQGNDSNSND